MSYVDHRQPGALGGRNPIGPCTLDPLPKPEAFTALDGSLKRALETGRTRLITVALAFVLAFCGVGYRLVDIAAFGGGRDDLTATAGPEAAPVFTVSRNDILDANGEILATSVPASSLYANPQEIIDVTEAATALNEALPSLSVDSITQRLSGEGSFTYLYRGLTPRQLYAVNRLGIPGFYFLEEERRIYPQGDLTAHLVGFTDIDGRGLAGIERSLDAELTSGTGPLRLSLDLRVQHILSEELQAAMTEFSGIGAAGVVMDAHSGEIVALVSLPIYDPLDPAAASEDQRFNRATLGTYEMGSVFKIFTTALALDRGVVGLSDGYDTTNPIHIGGFTITDFKPKNRWLSIPEIFIYSSNIGTVHMAQATGTAAQRDFLANLGLLRPAAIELPEVGTPMGPSPWRDINTVTISYGHGLAVSPLQVAAAVGAIVNGGTFHDPSLLAHDDIPEGQRVIGAETSEIMRHLMRLVVLSGTGRQADTPGYEVGGKTGTADKLVDGRYVDDQRIASFVGAFPMSDPQYVILAMVDSPQGIERTYGYATGGWVTAPVVARVVERAAPLLGVMPRADGAENEDIGRLLITAGLTDLAPE